MKQLKSRIFRRRAAAALLLAGAITVCGCTQKAPTGPDLLDPIQIQPDLAIASYEDLFELTAAEGCLLPQSVPVYFPVDGELGDVYVVPGQAVKKGDVLASLDVEQLQKQLKELTDQMETAQRIAQLQYNRLLAASDIQRTQRDALQESGTDPMALRLKEIDVWEAWQNVEHTQQNQELAQRELQLQIDELTRQLEEYAEICAPVDGTVGWISAQAVKGQMLAEDKLLLCISDPTHLTVRTDRISDTILSQCDQIYAQIGEKRYPLTPVESSMQEDMEASLREQPLQTTFTFAQEQPGLDSGANALVLCRWKYTPQVLTVPSDAIYRDAEGCYVYRVEENEKVRTPVEIGSVTALRTEILSGLEEGDAVYVQD